MQTVVVNNEPYSFSTDDFPLLIHGRKNEGSSLLTIQIAAQLFEDDQRIILLCGYPQAKEEFLRQIRSNNFPEERALFFLKGQEDDFISATQNRLDRNEYITFIKNIELFDTRVFEVVRGKRNIALSGNIDDCLFSEQLNTVTFKTKIYFSEPKKGTHPQIPLLEKYSGFFCNPHYTGIIRTTAGS